MSNPTPERNVVREAQTVENYDPLAKQKAAAKLSRIPVKVEQAEVLKKPEWIRVKAGSPTTRFYEIKDVLRANKLVTVCEEASCPNIGECFGKGTATFMIMGDKCTRRCPFCDVGHGRPDPLDVNEPENLSTTSSASPARANSHPRHRSKCWCPTSAAASTKPSTSSPTVCPT
jgi:lipoyl synthase